MNFGRARASLIPLVLAAPVGAQTFHVQEAKLTALDAGSIDRLGTSVDLQGDRALLGAPGHDAAANGSGAVYVHERSGTTWAQVQKITPAAGGEGDSFGTDVALDGTTLATGSPGDDHGGGIFSGGSVHVFVLSGTTWTEQAKIVPPGVATSDVFGTRVALDGDTLLIGAPLDDDAGNNTGAAYVYVRSGTTWSLQAKLTSSDAADFDQFANDVALDGNTALIGTAGDDDAGNSTGAAYVFMRAGTTWIQQAKLLATDGAAGDRVGIAVDVEGTAALVGAFGDDGGTGSAYVFTRSGTTWTQEAKLTADNGDSHSSGDNFGYAVDLEADTALIGARFAESGGSAYLFERTGTTWTQVAALTGALPIQGDQIGTSVAYDGVTVLSGNPSDDTRDFSAGAAVVFRPTANIAVGCVGDGSGTSCPCVNGSLGRGCDNAQGTGGVLLRTSSYLPDGSGGGTALFEGVGYPPLANPTVIAMRSPVVQSPAAFGDGLLCLQAPIVRFGAMAAARGESAHPTNHGAGSGTFTYQLWYRNNPASYCDPTAAFNTSNALDVHWP